LTNDRRHSILRHVRGALIFLLIVGCSAPAAELATDAGEPFVPRVETSIAIDAELDAATPPPRARSGVMMQAFYWNYPNKPGLWSTLRERAPSLAAAGIDAVWIPPPYKGAFGSGDVGYGVYDRYDLGEFEQRGTIATRYGSRKDLVAAIDALHENDIRVYADIVMNHMMGGDEERFTEGGKDYVARTKFAYPSHPFVFDHTRFNGCDHKGWVQWSPWDFAARPDAWDNLLGCELRLRDPAVSAHLIEWGKWLTSELKLDGYRLDAVKHMYTPFLRAWIDAVRGDRFLVSEAWFGDRNQLIAYAGELGRSQFFDVPLHYAFSAMAAGNYDMRNLRGAGLVGIKPELAVTFVDNHDTTNAGALYSPVSQLKLHAYAYMLLRERGVPCVFWKDWFEDGLGGEIEKLIALRISHGKGEGREHDESDADVYIYERTGGLLLLLNDGAAASKKVTTTFRSKTLVNKKTGATVTTNAEGVGTFTVSARDYAVWTRE
jgi:alpha-amylase